MQHKNILRVLILILVFIGIGTTIYKIKALGFSFSPDKTEKVWTIEAELTLNADGGPVKVSLNAPDNTEDFAVTDVKVVSPG